MATAEEKLSTDKSLMRNYSIDTQPIPRISISDASADDYISQGKPVIFTDSDLVSPALRWDLEFLNDNIGDGDFTVYESENHKFKYFDETKAKNEKSFKEPMKRTDMSFSSFIEKLKNHKSCDKHRIYLQQALTDGVGKQIVVDFINFNWAWVTRYQKLNKWGPLTSNLLLISQEGNVTPCHYDEQENFFTQVKGRKRVLLFAPDQFECLYPYPVHHPHDRQSQVDFDNPNYEKYPKFRNLTGYEAILEPGEVLYLPMYWWHQFESLFHEGPTISVTFWYKAADVEKQITYPLKSSQKVAMMRNIEKLLLQGLNSAEELYPFMRNLVIGRYTDVEGST